MAPAPGPVAPEGPTEPDDGPWFTADVVETGRRITLIVRGELDVASESAVRSCLVPLAPGRRRSDVTIDATGLRFADASGLERILLALDGYEPTGRPRLLSDDPRVRLVLELTHLDARFDVAP